MRASAAPSRLALVLCGTWSGLALLLLACLQHTAAAQPSPDRNEASPPPGQDGAFAPAEAETDAAGPAPVAGSDAAGEDPASPATASEADADAEAGASADAVANTGEAGPDTAPSSRAGVGAGEAEASPPPPSYTPQATPPTPTLEVTTLCQGRRIRSLRTDGMQRVARADITTTMGLRQGDRCTDRALTAAVRQLWNLGFFDDIVVQGEAIGKDGIALRVTVLERPAIGKITLEGNDQIDDEDIEEKISLEEGEILSIPAVQRQVTKIRDLYAEEGYFLAHVHYALRPMRTRHKEIELRFIIDEGEEVEIRRLRFVGNRHVRDKSLHKAMQSSETSFWSLFSSSNKYNKAIFEEDLTRLQALYYDKG
ncbi:MAG: POTRA domain-containing protein, partial [Polyangiales bacterium]